MREDGFYWVKPKSPNVLFPPSWEVGRWDEDCWFLTGEELDFSESEMLEIGERITHDGQ